ncbi:MAG: nucleotidyltransferase family protein [Acidobacteria bacterium]|nr:nucleotidyltransferase family protein [Acidobacteriota bacterium]
MRTRLQTLQILEDNLERIKAFGVKQLGIFGSVARGEETEKSDIDVLVDLERETFDNYMGLLFYLEDLFGKKVDLAIKNSLKPRIRDRILSETVYVKGL